jgi:hypothetical protein
MVGLDGSDPVMLRQGRDAAWQPVNPFPFGLVDPATGEWHLRQVDGHVDSFFFGNPGDVPFMGDWDCDGIDTPGLYRQLDGYVYLRNTNTQGNADVRFFFGDPGDIPLAGDFNGDGCDTVSVYRPSNATFYIVNELGSADGGLGAADYHYIFGNPGDKPFMGTLMVTVSTLPGCIASRLVSSTTATRTLRVLPMRSSYSVMLVIALLRMIGIMTVSTVRLCSGRPARRCSSVSRTLRGTQTPNLCSANPAGSPSRAHSTSSSAFAVQVNHSHPVIG